MDGPGGDPVGGEVGVEALAGVGGHAAAVPEDPGQAGAGGVGGGHDVDLVLVLELQGVLDAAQEAVGRRQLVGRLGVHVARRPHLGQHVEGGRGAQSGVEAAVDQLQELEGELDVPDATGAPLDLVVAEAPPSDLLLGPVLHLPHGPDVVGIDGVGPQGVLGGVGPGLPQVGVTGDRAGLEQGLALPGLGPSLPVSTVGGHRTHQWPVAALRAEPGVDPETGAGQVEDPAGLPSQGLRLPVADEEDVDVAGVVELAAAELAHADHGQVVGRGQADRPREDVGAQAGQGRGDGVDGVLAGQVAGGDAEQLPVLPCQQVRTVAGALGGA